ncbi:MAG: histidinol dehydrogenase [Verrucomicrobiales bacterium]
MKIIRYSDADYAEAIAAMDRRAYPSDKLRDTVAEILFTVRTGGDNALLSYVEKFDRAVLTPQQLRVSEEEFAAAAAAADEDLKTAVAASITNVRSFARKGLRQGWKGTNTEGAEVGEVYHPLSRVGIYVPGGTAPLVSTALMTVPIAAEAGVPEIVVTTPCGADGTVNPALLYALREAGVAEVYKLGGAQAIAALAFGTESIRPVEKVYGPGNSYVVEAKRQVFGAVGVDLLPGPSEVLVLADASARADWIAADLLAQAEHGKDSQIVFVTDNPAMLDAVISEVENQAAALSRQGPLRSVLDAGTWCVLERSLDEAVRLVNAYAPEHLSLVVADADSVLPEIRTAGAIYVGAWSPVAVGDFLAGPSHELPTGGAGKAFPGLTTDMFQRRTSVVRYDAASIKAAAPIVATFARVEGLDAHGNSVSVRAKEAP